MHAQRVPRDHLPACSRTRPSARFVCLAGLALAFGLASCSFEDEFSPSPADETFDPTDGSASSGALGEPETVSFSCETRAPDPSRPTVMVIDTGFDLGHPVFRDQVVACYHVKCDRADPVPPAETEDEIAAQLISELSKRNDRCHLVPGLSLRIESYLRHFDSDVRDQWNNALLGKTSLPPAWSSDGAKAMSQLLMVGSNEEFNYHGTGTAGVLAYGSDVNLVIVHINLSTAKQAYEALSCMTQEEVDIERNVLLRPDVQQAYIRAPLSSQDEELIALRRRMGVRVENWSFNSTSADKLEELMQSKGCDKVELNDWFRLRAELETARQAYRRQAGVFDGLELLTFQAAGNDGIRIDGPGDHISCLVDDPYRLQIGSYGLEQETASRSWFSNHGNCVSLYALGQDVIIPAPNRFVNARSGTSFASPLTARYAAMLARDEPTALGLRKRLMQSLDEQGFLMPPAVPAELSKHDPAPGMIPLGLPAQAAMGESLIDLSALPKRLFRKREQAHAGR